MWNFKQDKSFSGMQGSKHSRPLFMGAKASMQVAKKGDAFLIYVCMA
jgi:hypothetical protein